MAVTPVLLHGTLEVTIVHEVRHNNPNKTPSIWVQLMIYVVGWLLELLDWLVERNNTKLDAKIYLDGFEVGSRHIQAPMDRSWREHFYFHCAQMASNIKFAINDVTREVSVQDILQNDGQTCEWVLQLQGIVGPAGSRTRVVLKFLDARKHSEGIGSDFHGVRGTHYPQKNGCKVTLYQDAHIPADYVDKMSKDGLVNYEPKRCWEDIFDAIKKAEKFVYIAGWSLYTEITLLRDPTRKTMEERQTTLGELLKRKAENGQVKVVLLISDDPTAVAGYGGVMGIRSKEAKAYFRDTNVQCVWCSRHNSRVLYSHHQKIVVVDDSDIGGGIVSFIGGIDLCRGRYDTPDHSLFRTLQKNDAHNKDFHQASFVGSKIEKGGPREPWHDVHCRLEGPAACYVYDTFVQRCKKEGKEDILVPMNQLRDFFNSPSHGHQDNNNNNKAWNVQVFRSIDDKAVLDFPKAHHRNITKVGPRIFRGKYKIIDHSIEDAYIEAIRRAKNFIYIENEYFIGSDFGWSSRHKKFNASNLIPKEISLKIVSKIKAKEKFAVYVVIPMWPEGDPHGDGFVRGDFSTVQDMLLLQRKTIEMMYKDIVEALKQEKIKEDPQRYLSFFCLGNREVRKHGEYQPQRTPHRDLHYMNAQTSRRFMIYVHSKMMIVDDEYIIIGSANINHRSMQGGRDTEIAMGAYQPSYLASGQNGATGQIHGFRMSLWLEHLGICERTFINPESKECVSRVNQLAEKYWKSYSAGSFDTDLPGHLLRYPIQISNDGTVQELPGFQYFPDTFATILGKQSPLMHNT
ncbi:hypothetical protein HN51_000819 [Arachis hypogaea]|uniref:Phospholipase D n=1 Tax=Arachis duranensis TaxID=130453 RepID=A0A6P5N6Y8_ARADU|nr:phospholipase D alpha 2-like [Arachis duranensis]XP_025695164.1 phospholipase D alpha 2-like [Arachis hypogaea]XP_052108528.1 phospholipase D alpha 2-like [Arachis duranensis]QHO48806.1 Phospholipase D alpha [Arachis hypogaea]